MSFRGRKTWARAAVCAAALATPLAVSGCQSTMSASNSAGTVKTGAPAATSALPSASASTSAPASNPATTPSQASSTPGAQNATGDTRLTVADGGDKILINGQTVDFGTKVNDPAWSPDGSRVVFVDGAGDLVVANADGTGRTVAAHNPGGQTWSHPAWQTTQADVKDGLPARDNIFFASTAGGGTLWEVPTGAHDAQPEQLPLNGYSGNGQTPPPEHGNSWPAGGGDLGSAVYEHDGGASHDVYVRDDYLRQTSGLAITDAAEPGFAVVGSFGTGQGIPKVVFVRKVGGREHVFLEAIQTQNPSARDMTPNATTDCADPVISPDGNFVAYSTASGVFTVTTDSAATPTQVTNTPGFPAFRPVS